MHFYDGESVSSDGSQSEEPDTGFSTKSLFPLEPAGADADAVADMDVDVDAIEDSDDDTLVFDMDAQSRKRRSASPSLSSTATTDVVISNTSEAEAFASSTLPSLQASSAATLSSLPNEAEPSTSDVVPLNDKPNANARDIVCQPMRSSPLRLSSETQSLSPLFLPADRERLWYLGFLTEWDSFEAGATGFWLREDIQDSFAEIKDRPVQTSRLSSPDLPDTASDPERLVSFFQREAVEIMVDVFNMLVDASRDCYDDEMASVRLAKAEEDELASEGCQWAPKYLIRASLAGEDEETQLIGHVEFLGGKAGALSEAYRLRKSNRWGSLRCVLGDVAHWMLLKSLRFGYIVSGDEIMFLAFVIEEKHVHGQVVFSQPWLNFSKPIKHTDTFDEAKGTISVRQGLLYLFANAMDVIESNTAVIDEDIWDSLNYAKVTAPGRHWKPKDDTSQSSST